MARSATPPIDTGDTGDRLDPERLDAAIAHRFGSARELARAIGEAPSQITRWRQGQALRAGRSLLDLCGALGVPWAHLFRLERDPTYLGLLRQEIAGAFGESAAALLDDLQRLPGRRRERVIAELRERLREGRDGS